MNFFEVLEKFEISSQINNVLKENIERFHVFDDIKGNNVLFITSDDKVFGFGSNFYGCCGLGHNSVVNEPQLIPELCNKNIKQFFIGCNFVLALSSDHQLYGWGQNNFGQLGRDYLNDRSEFLRPEVIIIPNETIFVVSCGAAHSLAITLEGNVYGWGANTRGQIGCGDRNIEKIAKPILLKVLSELSIKSINCSWHRSYLLTTDGLVYSWGYNDWCHLGHDLDKNQCIFEPKLIDNICDIISIAPTGGTTNFLTKEGLIYFCGYFKDNNDKGFYQKLPRLLNSETKFSSLYSVPHHKKEMTIACAVSHTSIDQLFRNQIMRTDKQTVFSFYCEEFQLSYKTIALNDNPFESIDRFNEKFINHQKLGKGGYGSVFEVTNIFDRKKFAIKKIFKKEMDETTYKKLMREVNTLSKCSAEYVVQYFDSWIENDNCLYIQMEFCSDNLKNIIQEKKDYFRRQRNGGMTTIEFFISGQFCKELLECVAYLHGSNPPIIHRDLKPENILICVNKRNLRHLKIGDFGLAKFVTSSVVSHTDGVGTPRYMAPEVNNTKYNTKADIWSLSFIFEDLFEYNINSTEIVIIDNNYLSNKWSALKDLITSMRNYHDYKARPTCAQLLSNLREWSISSRELLESDFNYSETFVENTFFQKYFNSKLLTPYNNSYLLPTELSIEALYSSDIPITFVVNNEEIHCIRLLLMLKSQEFKNLLEDRTQTKFIISDLNPVAFRLMIYFIYFDEIKLDDQTRDQSLMKDVQDCAQRYNITNLVNAFECSLFRSMVNIHNFYQITQQFNSNEAIELSRKFIEDNFDQIVNLDESKIIQINSVTDNYLFKLYIKDKIRQDKLIKRMNIKW